MNLLKSFSVKLNNFVAKREAKVVEPKSANRQAVDQLLGSSKNAVVGVVATIAETSPASIYRAGKKVSTKAVAYASESILKLVAPKQSALETVANLSPEAKEMLRLKINAEVEALLGSSNTAASPSV